MADDIGTVVDEAFEEALSSRYLAYALSTITSRALPDVRDGLKPVHRRILYVMRDLKLDPEGAFRKCAKVVGDVIGRFHPHGDQAVYDALVRLAQDFAVRAPLVDGQGNFGNVDGDSAAAMRYTESRLTRAGTMLLDGVHEDAVDMRATYDGTEEEPVVLPAAFPNLLVNGASGIAVGMAANLPPHNPVEACAAARLVLTDPTADVRAVLELMPGPDFPTGGIVIEDGETLAQIYETGRGPIRVRAVWNVEEGARGQWRVVVTEIPFQTPKSKLIAKIDDLVAAKKLPLVADVEDESAEDVRIVLTPKSRNIDAALMMESLFRTTELEARFGVNMNVLDAAGKPRVMGVVELLRSYADHRLEVLRRRTAKRLADRRRRLEVVQGQLIVHLDLDEVIRIIRNEEKPKPKLIARFDLTDIQAEAILETRLRALRKLDEMELKREEAKLEKEIAADEALLASEAKQVKAVDGELADAQAYFAKHPELGARRTRIEAAEPAVDFDLKAALVAKEPITVVITEKGWIRSAKGHGVALDEIRQKEGDAVALAREAFTTSHLALMASDGRAYPIPCDKLPDGRGEGAPLRLFAELPAGVRPVALLDPAAGGEALLVSDDGRGFRVSVKDLSASVKAGKVVMTPDEGVALMRVLDAGGGLLALIGENRKILIFPVEDVPELKRGRGVILQRYAKGGLSDAAVFDPAEGVFGLDKAGRRVALGDWEAYQGKRGQAGSLAPKGFPRSGRFG